MGAQTLVLEDAWNVYDHWLADSRVDFNAELTGMDDTFRDSIAPFAGKAAHKLVGDCYLLAYAKQAMPL